MTPEQAAVLLEKARGMESISERAEKARDIIRALCKGGYVEEAWALIEKDTGKVRSAGLEAFFGSLDVSVAVFGEKFRELNNEDETMSAMNSRLENYSAGSLLDSLLGGQGDADFLALGKLDSAGFSNAVYNRLHHGLESLPAGDREGRMDDTHELQEKGLIRPVEVVRMFYKMGDYDVFRGWDRLTEYTAGVDYGEDRNYVLHTREWMLARMLKESSTQTMDVILGSNGPDSSVDLQLAVGQWTELDSRGASDWYRDNAARLTPDQQSAAAAGFFGKALDSGDLSMARQWAEQITKPAMKDAAMGAIDRKLREMKTE